MSKKVIVYSGPGCPACVQVKEYLTKKGVEFEMRDISVDESAQGELMDLGIMSIPVTVIDGGEPIVGTDYKRIEAALA